MSLQQTSLSAYESVKPELGQRQYEVLHAIKQAKEATNAMLAQKLNLPINCITPRTLELRHKGLVEESYKDKCPITGRTAIFWRAI